MRSLALAVLLSAGAAWAAEPREVQLEAQGAVEDVDALRASLEDWLRTMQLQLKVVPQLDNAPAFARVRVVWTPAECVVEVFRGADGALRRKKSLPRSGAPLLVTESAALVAQAGVQELELEEKARAPLPVVPPPVVEADVPPSPPSAGFGLAVGASVLGRSYDAQAPFVFGGGAEVSASLGAGAWRPVATLLASYQGPVARDAALVSLQVQTVSVRLLAGVERDFSAVGVLAGLGGGFDVLIANVRSTQVPRDLLHPRTDVAPFFTAGLGVRWRPSESSALFLRALVDLDPARRRYRSDIAGETTTLLEPWTVRPGLQVGVSFDVISRRGP